jgi:hypothetical protein
VVDPQSVAITERIDAGSRSFLAPEAACVMALHPTSFLGYDAMGGYQCSVSS